MPRGSTDTAVALRCRRSTRLVGAHRVRLDGLPHLGEGHAEVLSEPGCWNDDAPAETEALELAAGQGASATTAGLGLRRLPR